jgi:hypothetical protein
MTMSEPSTLQLDLPMSCVEDSRVRTPVSPANELAWPERVADSGLNTAALLAKYDPATQLWKTSQLSLFGGYQTFSATWPRSGTMRNGIAYQLPPLVRLTDEIAFGLWRTPDASVITGGAVDAEGRRAQNHQVNLHDQVHTPSMWPTPAATPYGTTNNGRRGDGTTFRQAGKPSLETMARRGRWPTPTAGDSQGSGSRNTPQSNAHPGISLTDAVRGDQGTGRLWPTPVAGDSHTAAPNQNTSTLGRAIRRGEGSGGLNPTWVEWLLGFPLGWTDCGASATRSSRRSRR